MITVKYKIMKSHCPCCNQKLPETQIKEREITINKELAMSWMDWRGVEPEDVESVVPNFLYDTISFYASDLNDKIFVEPEWRKKTKEFLLREVVGKQESHQS